MKLYADEPGREEIRAIELIAVSIIARVEVSAAIWRKHRMGEVDVPIAVELGEEFEADWFGTYTDKPRFIVVPLNDVVLERAAGLAASPGLRAHDALQLASALAAREAQPQLSAFACFDRDLRSAAFQFGLTLIPDS